MSKEYVSAMLSCGTTPEPTDRSEELAQVIEQVKQNNPDNEAIRQERIAGLEKSVLALRNNIAEIDQKMSEVGNRHTRKKLEKCSPEYRQWKSQMLNLREQNMGQLEVLHQSLGAALTPIDVA